MKGCPACSMLYCTPCSSLNLQRGKKYKTQHCQKHCRHKSERHLIAIPKGFGD